MCNFYIKNGRKTTPLFFIFFFIYEQFSPPPPPQKKLVDEMSGNQPPFHLENSVLSLYRVWLATRCSLDSEAVIPVGRSPHL